MAKRVGKTCDSQENLSYKLLHIRAGTSETSRPVPRQLMIELAWSGERNRQQELT